MDINEAIENELPNTQEIKELMEERNQINKWKKELEERRKLIDSNITSWMKDNDIKEVSSGNINATIVRSKGSGRWNKEELVTILSPLQLEKVYSEGKPYTYLKIVEKAIDKETG